MGEDVLRERGEAFQLYPEHAAVWETVCDIDYLLEGAGSEVCPHCPESDAQWVRDRLNQR